MNHVLKLDHVQDLAVALNAIARDKSEEIDLTEFDSKVKGPATRFVTRTNHGAEISF